MNPSAANASILRKVTSTLLLAATAACGGTETGTEAEASSVAAIYPQFGKGAVGDPMPHSINGRLHIFYLFDGPTGGEAFHPWYSASTADFISYADRGEALPVVQDRASREFALGTGSVIQVGDTYHAYYTGFNKSLNPFEAILHATSKDMVHWTKHPEHTFYAPAGYERNDFRDPHVIRVEEKGEYWMLLTARSRGRGVIAKLVSRDLVKWEDGGILFVNDSFARDANLECPTLFKIGDRWYLTFSDQWPTRRTQYRVSRRIDGPFEKPKRFALDGAGFYAGKAAQHAGQHYVAGWVPRKELLKDSGDFVWGGNLVVHQLGQQADGSLAVRVPESIRSLFAGSTATHTRLGSVALQGAGHELKYQGVFGDDAGSAYRIAGKFRPAAAATGSFGFEFGVKPSGGRVNLVIDAAEQSLKFFNVPLSRSKETKPQAQTEIEIGTTLNFEIYINGSVVVMYVDDAYAFSSRMYGLLGAEWGVFSENTAAELSDLTVSRVKLN
jgi:beta-fructofuranosidase